MPTPNIKRHGVPSSHENLLSQSFLSAPVDSLAHTRLSRTVIVWFKRVPGIQPMFTAAANRLLGVDSESLRQFRRYASWFRRRESDLWQQGFR